MCFLGGHTPNPSQKGNIGILFFEFYYKIIHYGQTLIKTRNNAV